MYKKRTSKTLICLKVSSHEVSLEDAISSYLFNSQIVTISPNEMLLIAPSEAEQIPSVLSYLEQMMAKKDLPIKEIKFLHLRESMKNGGGPACLRLRIVLTDEEMQQTHQSVYLTNDLYLKLYQWIEKHYRDHLTQDDIADPQLLEESYQALDELTKILSLGSIYSFQK